MYFFKIAGALMLVFSSFTGVWMINSGISKTLSQSEALIKLIRFIRAQVECFSLPASEIILRCDRGLLCDCGYCGENLPSTFSELFESFSVKDGELKEIMKGFALGFGRVYRDEQLKECDYYLSLLCARRQKLCEELPRKKKVNRTLCISSVFAILILFL